MSSSGDPAALKPLLGVDGDAVFDEAWQAEALAIADTLVQSGMFTARAWSEALGRALREAQIDADSDNQQTYYQCVLSALESLVADNSEVGLRAMHDKRKDWEAAYLSTPHGKPVRLK